MACYNIVDHRHHANNSKCDAVFEPVIRPTKNKVTCDLCDIEFLRKTTVAKAILRAQTIVTDVTVWLYDSGSISKDEVRECKKSSS